MPIPDYEGETFVAFADISGFKEMMRQNAKAVKALDEFYTVGYRILENNRRVHGLFISDCAVLFVHNHDSAQQQLLPMLDAVEQMNRGLLQHEIMLTTSIARGLFSYHQRLEFSGIEKNPVYGNGYVAAFLDNESGQPRIQPGQCRILKRGLENIDAAQFTRLKDSGKHLDFYWMVTGPIQIPMFSEKYSNTYQQKYRGMFEAINEAANNRLGMGPDTEIQ